MLVLQLDRPVNISEAVAAVSFLRAGGTDPAPGTMVETSGWGSQDNLGSRPDKLKEVAIEVLNPIKCRRADYFGRKFTGNMICAHRMVQDNCGNAPGIEDSCDVSSASVFVGLLRSILLE